MAQHSKMFAKSIRVVRSRVPTLRDAMSSRAFSQRTQDVTRLLSTTELIFHGSRASSAVQDLITTEQKKRQLN